MMTKPQRIVLDINLIISRMLLTRGVAAAVFDLVYDTCFLLTSEPVLALSGRADLILTGDEDLLVLHPWRGVSILTPSAYLQSIA